MTTRHLATIERIADIRSIPDADAIEAAVVRGWTVVVKKGEFAIGDRCVYFEIDSFLPHVGPFEFLASRGSRIFDDVRGHVLRTIRLRGVYSQGLVLPLAAFPELTGNNVDGVGDDGRDVSDELGVTKYEAPLPASLSGIALGEFPTRLAPKTDSERVQNLVTSWDHLCTYGSWIATEKIDGSSMTVINDEGTIRVCSRNLELADVASNTLWQLTREHRIDVRLAPGEFVQGEVYGEGIQGNPLKLRGQRLSVFVFGRDRSPLANEEWPAWARDLSVPHLALELPATIEEALAQVDGLRSSVNPACAAEGVVWHERNARRFNELDGRSNFKVISNKYLLKHSD